MDVPKKDLPEAPDNSRQSAGFAVPEFATPTPNETSGTEIPADLAAKKVVILNNSIEPTPASTKEAASKKLSAPAAGVGDSELREETGRPVDVARPKAEAAQTDSERILALRTNEDFRFKVNTVKWFGALCAIVIIVMIGLGFWYLDRIVTASQAYESEMNFSKVLSASPVNNDIVLMGLEHDGLGMRNKRGISSLYMRAYTQFLALIAGTVLSLLGAIFVLARVDSVSTTSDATWGGVKWVLSSSSPGIIVSTIGAVLVGGVVYLASDPIQVFDAPVFLGRMSGAPLPEGTFESPAFEKTMSERLKDLKSQGQ